MPATGRRRIDDDVRARWARWVPSTDGSTEVNKFKRFAARILLFVVASGIALILADLLLLGVDAIYGLTAGEEVTDRNLHVRFATEYRDVDRRSLSLAEAAAQGYIVPIADSELVRAREILTGGGVVFDAAGRRLRPGGGKWINDPMSYVLNPVRPEGEPEVRLDERIEITGTAEHDGIYRCLRVEPDGTVTLDRDVASATYPAGVTIRGLRERDTFAPSKSWFFCFRGLEGSKWAPQFDADGCVRVDINSAMIREREELVAEKPPGQRRVVCIGDSFTFGWGVAIDDCWTRRVEAALRRTDDGFRTVNCGASGSMFPDEYVSALEHRFLGFEPDAVVLTLCLNDLLPTGQALAHQEGLPWILRHSRLLRDLLQGYALEGQLKVDPSRDLVGELLELPDRQYPLWCMPYPRTSVGRANLWPGGGPQRALLAGRDLCRTRGIPFGVVIWPYIQGLGTGEHYPFTAIHRLVADFCGENEIPFLDLLPALKDKVTQTDDLWVCPADYHPNARGHELATPQLTDFVQTLLRSN